MRPAIPIVRTELQRLAPELSAMPWPIG
jgi:hypothetical protein